jgi:O-antigen ligase
MAMAITGPAVPVVLAIMALGGLWLVGRPGIALGVLLALVIALEEDESGAFPATALFYKAVPRTIVSPCDLIFLALVIGFAYELIRNRRPLKMPDPFTWPLLLLMAAVAVGGVMGLAGGASPTNIFYVLRVYIYFLIIPLVVRNVLDDRAKQRLFVIGAAALATFKGIEGCVAYALGGGREIEGTTLTFFEPTANWMVILFLLGVLACRIVGKRMPWWIVPASLVSFLALVLSFRRSFWIAAVLGAIVVVVVATGQHGWRRLLPAVAAFVAAVTVVLFFAGPTGSAGVPQPVLDRAESINPTSVQASKSDRYRLTEQRNVLAEISSHPVTGLGLGVSWEARYPLSASFQGSRGYSHNILYNYWLKMGILGVLAYVWLMLAVLWAAWKVWRSRAEALVRAASLALFGGVLGLFVTDLTGSHTGVNLRLSTVFAAAAGWLAAVLATQRQAAEDDALDAELAVRSPEPVPN